VKFIDVTQPQAQNTRPVALPAAEQKTTHSMGTENCVRIVSTASY
jgi:hypothetical protein